LQSAIQQFIHQLNNSFIIGKPLSDFPSSFTTSIAEEDLKKEKGVDTAT